MSKFNRIVEKVFRRRGLKCVAAFALLSCHPVLAMNITDGYTPLGTWAPSIVSAAFGPYSMSTAGAYGWGWKLSAWQNTPTDGNGATCSIAGQPYTTIDGWSGYQIQPGVLIVLTGNLSATTISATPDPTTSVITDNYSASWDSKGAIITDWQSPGTASQCAGLKRTVTTNFYILDGGNASMNVSYGVYVSPTAAAGPLPTTYLQLHKTSGTNRQAVLTLSDLVLTRTQCSMNTTSVVPFGDVTSGQAADGKGIAVQSSLNVNCTNEVGASADVSYSVTPKTQTGSEYTLPMISMEGGGTAGDIRGFLGANAATDAGCTDKASSVRMDSTKAALRTVTSTQSWSDPLVWVLCPRMSAEPGPATAAVTLDVIW